MKINRLLSALLAFIMLLGTLTCLATVPAFATEGDETIGEAQQDEEGGGESSGEEAGTEGGEDAAAEEDEEQVLNQDGIPYSWLNEDGTINYMQYTYKKPEEKLADMQMVLESDDGRYQLFIETVTGEIAYYDTLTKQALFSNPYNLNYASSGTTPSTKENLLSQIILRYSGGGAESVYNSYNQCVARDQLLIKRLSDGIRVEYAIGRVEARRLLPRVIERSSFENNIIAPMMQNVEPEMESFVKKKMDSLYTLKNPADPTLTTKGLKQMYSDFKITQKMAVYVWSPQNTDSEKDLVERYIKTYCPKYTYEMLEADHDLTEYSGTEKAPPLFRLSLEYYLDDGSLKVRLPSKGMRYVEADYSLVYLRVLPYFGCVTNSPMPGDTATYNGMLFIPDGSGALIRSSDYLDATRVITQRVYGQDYAYYQIEGEHQEAVRLPVYGAFQSYEWTVDESEYVQQITETGKVEMVKKETHDSFSESIGYLAVIENGAEMVNISSETGGALQHFDTIYTSLYTRANDSYDIRDAISAASSAMVSIRSNKKYTDDFVLRFFMLNGEKEAEAAGLQKGDYYNTDYNGLVNAYRDYLEGNGTIKRLTEEDVEENIPLYIESFGTIETDTTIMTFPVTVHTPLTTFDDLKVMYNRLKESGIENVNFRLSGFFNGGMNASIPYKTKVEKNVGGASGYRDFMEFANENGIGVYSDFDFVFVSSEMTGIASGLNKRQDLAQAADNRYASKREYSPLYQCYQKTGLLLLSPCSFDKFFEKFSKNYAKLNPNAVSVASLGSYLNSDFDEEETDLRNVSREYTEELFGNLKNTYGNVMTDGGNAYCLPYVTDILNVPLESSEFNNTSLTVPFMGMVLHGYVNFTGPALNMVGDINYEILRALENGSYAYFTLSYENTEELKKSEGFSKYYSISFDIWYNDLVSTYNTINENLKDLQTSLIVSHEFLTGKRDYSEAEWAEIDAAIEMANKTYAGIKLQNELAAIQARIVVDNGRIVKVTYENGTTFYLNYNNYAVIITDAEQEYTIEGLSFLRVN